MMTSSIVIATLPTFDTPGASLIVYSEGRSYVFGRMGEGTQRAFISAKVSIARADKLFLTGATSWEQSGGLPGYMLTLGTTQESSRSSLAEQNELRSQRGAALIAVPKQQLDVFGAENLCHLMASTRGSILRQKTALTMNEFREDPRSKDPKNLDPDWQDNFMRVWAIPVKRARTSNPSKRKHPESAEAEENNASQANESGQISDPSTAKAVVERIMYNEADKTYTALKKLPLAGVKSSDIAFIQNAEGIKLYQGPYAADGASFDHDAFASVLKRSEYGQSEGGPNGAHPRDLNIPRTSYSQTSISYIFKTLGRRGKFDRKTAEKLKVNVRDYKVLAAGQSVQNQDGETVTPDMVLGDARPGTGAIFADIESRDFLDPFFDRPEWQNEELMAQISVMFWILGPGLVNEPKVQDFILKHKNMKHVLCAPETSPNMLTNSGAATLQMRLRRIDPERFDVFQHTNTVSYPAPEADSPIVLARLGWQMKLVPEVEPSEKLVVPFPDLVTPYQNLDPAVVEVAEQVKTAATDTTLLEKIEAAETDIPGRDAEITALGTGSSAPSKYRNVSGTLIRVPGVGSYLLDCGEGTMGQIRRIFKPSEVEDILRNLKCVVISHLHADHHMGLPGLIKAWYEQTLKDGSTQNLAVSCIDRIKRGLSDISQIEDIGFHRLVFPQFATGSDGVEVTRPSFDKEPWGIRVIKRVPVEHCFKSFGHEVEFTNGLRVAYSGDCRPSELFAEACQGVHLLIHECTFEDGLTDHAKFKKHSTMSEALGVAKQMKARRLLLTHFSQRYCKSASLKYEDDEKQENRTLLAFDAMKIKLGDFQKAACYIPALDKMMDKLES